MLYSKGFSLLVLLILSKCVFSSLPSPYSEVDIIPEYSGINLYSNSSQMEALLRNSEIQVVIEIGSWTGGGSTRHLASLLKDRKGVVYAIDTWEGSSEHQAGQFYFDPVVKILYQQFLSNMIHWGFTDIVVPCRMTSLEAAEILDVKADLIYLDGNHEEEAVYADIKAWYPFVKDKGILCGDDWTWENVRKSVIRFAEENNLKIDVSGNFWRYYQN